MNGVLNMFFILCFAIGWIIIVLLVIGFLKGLPNDSACTGNCRQGRDCNCMEKKND